MDELLSYAAGDIDLLEEAMMGAMESARQENKTYVSKESIKEWIDFHRSSKKIPA